MKAKILLMLIGSILFLQSCATSPTMKLTSVASRDQKTAYDGTITSRKKHLVSLSPYVELGSGVAHFDLSKYKTLFMLSVENRDKEPISIGFDNLSVIFEGNSKDLASEKISIQSFDDFMADYETLYNDNEKPYIYNTVYNLYILMVVMKPPGLTLEQYENRMYDFRKNIIAGRTTKNMIQGMLQEYILERKTIIEPGNSYNGIVICDTSDLDPKIEGNFKVVVSVDSEEHKFTFRRSL